jgi:hypothetical protein
MPTPQEPLFLALQHLLEEDGSVSIGELLDRAGEQTYGFAILLLGLLTFIPAVANVVNLATLALGYQLFRRRPHPWIPERLQRYEMHRGRIKGLLAQVERYVRLLGSRHTPRRRMEGRGLGLLVAWTGFLAALPVILPAANILPAIGIVLIGVALLEEWPFLAWLGGGFSFITTVYFAVSFQQILHWGLKAFQALKGWIA